MKRLAIVGAGPMGVYTFFSLLKSRTPFSISIFERAEKAGVGMPFSGEDNSVMMLANIASAEIPPLTSSYLDWLQHQDADDLQRFGVDKERLHERQFLPRVLLGNYFRDQFLALLEKAPALGFRLNLRESCVITDIEATAAGVQLWADGESIEEAFDFVVIATGHVWPEQTDSTPNYFPSPWSGLLSATIPPCEVGIMGTSLSGIDAAMAVAVQHGQFVESAHDKLQFERAKASESLQITLMSRSGILPEADFYCPLPYEPLQIATEPAISQAVAGGSSGLLDRVFSLIAREISLADPVWSERVALATLDADSFAEAYFHDRERFDPFRWAATNLAEVERNRRDKYTVPWRYAILRLHEAVQPIVADLDDADRVRFSDGLCKVFIDNYAAIPPESIRRLLALRDAGVIKVLKLGPDYRKQVREDETEIVVEQEHHLFGVFIDARGQKPLKTRDLPFPRLRQQLLATGEEIPEIGDDYVLLAPELVQGRIAFGALPYLMHDQPFAQGITAVAEIGAAMAQIPQQRVRRSRRRLEFIDEH